MGVSLPWLGRAMDGSSNERHFAIERKDDRSHIGNASIHDVDWVSRTAWFGLFIGELTAWSRGSGTPKCANASIQHRV
jgi:RimJ/RimL family protein N-acetyltransferase